MHSFLRLFSVQGFLSLLLMALFAPGLWAEDSAAYFEKEIRPILAEHCQACHGPEKQQSGLRLDSRAALVAGGVSGPAIVAGDAEQSLLITAVRQTTELKMPKDGRLTPEQVAALEKWVAAGAEWPDSAAAAAPASMSERIAEARAKHWSFQPLRTFPEGVGIDPAWGATPLDTFVLKGLREHGLSPAPPADKRTLLRRATFDLIGLPPTAQEVEDFLADTAPDAFAKVVERLLASPQYGERWGRHWLDIVRYTDSFDSRANYDQDVAEAWRYRDWVIRAFNQDMPYDQFLRYQIAGDLLTADQFDPDGIVATAMLAIGNWPGGDADKEKMVTDIVDDQIDVVMRGMLGTTFTCARCHDHKFDPFTTRDYYSLAGIFFSSHIIPEVGPKTAGSFVLHLPLESPAQHAAREEHSRRMGEVQTQLGALLDAERRRYAESLRPRTADYVHAALKLAEGGQDDLFAFAVAQNLDPAVLARWSHTLGLRPDKLLTRATRGVQGKAGLDALFGETDTPSVVANSTGDEQSFLSIKQPAHSVAIHPGPTTAVAAAWRSPVDGPVSVIARVADADGTCGEGFNWRLQRWQGPAHDDLLRGTVPNGSAQLLNELPGAEVLSAVTVARDTTLALVVEPGASHSCDTTTIELQITELNGDQRVWNLAEDVAPSLLSGGNPHADIYGHRAVWGFFDLAGFAAKPALPEFEAWSTLEASTPETRAALTERLQNAAISGLPADQSPFGAWLEGEQSPFWVEALVSTSPAREYARPPGEGDLGALQAELRALQAKRFPPVELSNGVREGGVPGTEHEGLHDVAVHIRGQYNRLGDVVPRGFPEVLAADRYPRLEGVSGRRELADWVASPENPLTARVMVNRIWQHHFGQGIARTPGDFGRQGSPPSHPELLDYLASEFIRSGWSVKAVHRLILLSSAWQQSAQAGPESIEKDPDNQWLSHMNRRRLEAEPLRDAMLYVSGQLSPEMGGVPFSDLLSPRRTVYFKTVRSDRTSYTMLFDAADPTSIIPQRAESLVAPQALFLMNHPFVLAQAGLLAAQVAARANTGTSTNDQIQWLYARLYGRPAAAHEVEIGRSLLGIQDPNAVATVEAWTEYCQVLLSANEFIFVD